MAVTPGDAQAAWKLASVEYNAEKVDGVYTVTAGDVFAPISVTELGSDTALSPSEYTLVYVNTSNQIISANYTLTKKAGDMPANPASNGGYQIAIIKGYVDKTTIDDGDMLSKVAGDKPYLTQAFDVVAKSTSLSGVSVASADDASVTEFTYNGAAQNVAFYMNGEKLDKGYTIVWNETNGATPSGTAAQSFTVTNAGTYSATLYATPNGGLSGSCEVEFTVNKLDLSTAKLTAADQAPVAKNVTLDNSGVQLYVNGDTIEKNIGVSNPVAYSYKDADGEVSNTFTNLNAIGQYTYKVSADKDADGNDEYQNVTGEGYVTVTVYGTLVSNFKYSGANIAEGTSIGKFTKSLGQSFNPGAITVEDSYDGFTYTVTNKDGQEFTSDWANLPAGEYNLTITANPAPKYAKGGSRNCTFTVAESTVNYANAVYFVYIDGKVYNDGDTLPYTGSAYVPTVVVKDGQSSRVLTEGADYNVTLKDAQNNVVEGFTAVANGYQVCIEFADGKTKPTVTLNIERAKIVDARATAPFFAVGADGTAAQPVFEGNTMADFEGQTFDLAGLVSPTYFKVKASGYYDANGNAIYQKDGAAVDPVKLTEPGLYAADVTVMANAENVTGSVSAFGALDNSAETVLYNANGTAAAATASVANAVVVPGLMFEVSEFAGYTDVDANAWYADAVYDAKGLGYMTGIAGTSLFMPEANINRAQVAQVVTNLANEDPMQDVTYPTRFSDVPADAWFAFPIFWASQANVVTGYGDTGVFGPYDNATREQLATMLYRYTQVQGKDVSGQADLSGYADAASVSDWAAEAVAWAVDAGIMGVDTDALNPQGLATRAEVAAMVVRLQPEALA